MSTYLNMKPIQVYNGPPGRGPNPWKVIIILIELGLPWENLWIPYKEIKQAPYTDLNPNGRLPVMIDPNTGVTLFESGAIIQYLISLYDTKYVISYSDDKVEEKWLLNSWLMFQMSGQGPMLGQKMWFTHFHQKKNVTTAIDRYANETKRIVGVIDSHLSKQRQARKIPDADPVWLVGDKCTYADLAFVPWDMLLVSSLFPDGGFDPEEFPEFYKWHKNAIDRPAVRETLRQQEHANTTMEDTTAAVLPERED